MATDAYKGYGYTIQHGTSGGTPDTLIIYPKDCAGPEIIADSVEVTNSDSPSGYKEYISGLKDNGDVSFDIVYEAASYAAVVAIIGTTKAWLLTLPDASYLEFEGHVSKIGFTMPINDVMVVPLTIKVTGAVSFTDGTS